MLIFLPLLLLKTQFWLILFFVFIAIYIQEKNNKYIYFALSTLVLLFIYLKFSALLSDSGTSNSILFSRYGYIFNAPLNEVINIVFANITKKLVLMGAFFVPFMFLINYATIKKEEILIFITLLFPVFSYCILSTQIAMTYWTHEHYVLPLLALVFIMILKNKAFTKKRIFAYVLANLALIIGILSLKQPWQYKYYQDEKQLIEQVKPLLNLEYSDDILAEDRTGIYFANYQVDYLYNIKTTPRSPKYIVFNTRYTYSSKNLKLHKPKKTISTFEYINGYSSDIKNYEIIYLNYPFIVYGKNIKTSLSYNKKMLDSWDKKTISSNKW